MSNPHMCPHLLPLLVVGNDVPLVAQISSALARKRSYLAVIDEPRIHRPDAANECVRRHNAAARVKAEHIVFANVAEDIVAGIDLPSKRIIRVTEIDNLYQHSEKLSLRDKDYFDWGNKNIAIGLLKSLRAKKILRIIPDGPNATEEHTESGHFVICEDHEELATIQAANYAYSLGAGLKIVQTFPNEKTERILESLYSANANIYGENRSPTERLRDIAAEMRAFIGELPTGTESVTFVTTGIPWGFAYPERPTTHLFTYPDLGTHLANAFAAEQAGSPGIRVAAVIEPGQVNAAEVDTVVDVLCRRGALIREYQGERATVRTVYEAIEFFPYDLLFISSHCGDVEGWQWTYNFKDSAGKDRELVVDVAASFGVSPGDELVSVRTHEKFVSLDGVPWNDPKKDEKLVVGTALRDWIELAQEPNRLEPTKKIKIPRVHGSAAIKVFDHHLLIMPSQLASHNTPIVINNACTSWHQLAKNFIFMNARSYLGTLLEVGDSEAYEIIKRILDKAFDRPLSVALWHAQNTVYGESVRRPYVLSGPHFQKLHTTTGSKVPYLGRLLIKLHDEYVGRLKTGKVPEKFIKDWKGHIEFFKYELNALAVARGNLEGRPSSARERKSEPRVILG